MAQTPPRPREHIETTLTQHEVAAKITAARMGRIAAKITAGDFDLAHVRDMYLALEVLTIELVKAGDAQQCAARHEACNPIAARGAAA